MKEIFEILNRKPKLYEQTNTMIWEDSHISKGMLEAHLDTAHDSATRKYTYVKESVAWIASMFPPNEYQEILDLGCGPGIYTELFCEAGYRVTGMDISKRSIQYAEASATKKGLPIQYVLEDYTKVDLANKYHLITLIYCDFGVLSSKTREVLLKTIFDALQPNGALLFDVFTPLKYEGIEEYKRWDISENGFWNEKLCITLQSFYRYDEDCTYLNQYTTLTKDSEIHTYHVWDHTFTCSELENDLKQAGFCDIHFYRSVVGGECTSKDETICVIAIKR